MSIRILVVGHQGKLGQVIVDAIEQDSGLSLIAGCGHGDNLNDMLTEHQPDIAIDATQPDCVLAHANTIIEHNVRPIIATSGLSSTDIDGLVQRCQAASLGGLVIPNFSLSAACLTLASQMAATHFSDIEIFEAHHPKKLDAPSGTARHLAHTLAGLRKTDTQAPHDGQSARGDNIDGIPVHASRLPGVIAEQTVMFGGLDETLTMSQRISSRQAFMPGVQLSCHCVMDLDHMVVGLEHLLD